MRSMTVCRRTFSDQHGRGRRRDRLPLPSIPVVLLILGLLSMSAYSKDPAGSTRRKTTDKAATTAESPKMGGHTFSSDLDLHVFIIIVREGEEHLQWIGETPSARPLDIPRCESWGVSPIGRTGRIDMRALARQIAAKKIPQLRFRFWAVDGDLAHLKGLTGLRELHLQWTKITGAGLAHLKDLTGLRVLDLRGTKITDAGLAHLKGLTGLRELDLRQTKITDAGLTHLKGLTGLRVLNLESTQITDAGLAHLKGLTGLWWLNLGETQITDAGLAHLKDLTGLRKLVFGNTQITDAGLVHLRGLTGLRVLYFWGTKITDAGLTHIKGLTGLRKLYLGGDTQITDAGLADLRKALPKTDINR